ncbi:MAG: alpha/beta hydrolase, partial [Pseudomonadota bacterium]
MKRRTFLWSSAALMSAVGLVGCVGTGEPYDASNAEVLYPPIGKFVTVDGLKLHYWEAGEGPPLILIHGASGNVRDWTFSIAPELAKEFRVIAFDRPGFGFSDRQAEDGWDPGVQARAIQAGAQAIGAENPIVIGHSWGGAVAMSWALQFPEQTRGVIPISAVTMPYGGMSRVFRAIGLD